MILVTCVYIIRRCRPTGISTFTTKKLSRNNGQKNGLRRFFGQNRRKSDAVTSVAF
ncbi:hypothetical protein MTR67_031222 [Solanum verrucosum]|uniref:Uncharacterized protein n=1 Tax=Solanum verrucosum TaxID=315347 RepID=A0AAF0U217_SOLVR|nr:hypothetical protein MTR67_031222 [Solanum verrucosum]